MPGEISKPRTRKHWFATDEAGVIHTGITEPDQVTSSGLLLVGTDTPQELLVEIDTYKRLLPSLPTRGREIRRDNYYNDNGTVVRAKVDHEATGETPLTRTDLFEVPS